MPIYEMECCQCKTVQEDIVKELNPRSKWLRCDTCNANTYHMNIISLSNVKKGDGYWPDIERKK
jgi:predicted nucleic acid-binding Zn ribbon protein